MTLPPSVSAGSLRASPRLLNGPHANVAASPSKPPATPTGAQCMPNLSRCLVTGCPHPYKAKGYCRLHYHRFLIHGDPHITKKPGKRAKHNARALFIPSHLALNEMSIPQLEALITRVKSNIAKRRAQEVPTKILREVFEQVVSILKDFHSREELAKVSWDALHLVPIHDSAIAMDVRAALLPLRHRHIDLSKLPTPFVLGLA